jgi:hypothetical protein
VFLNLPEVFPNTSSHKLPSLGQEVTVADVTAFDERVGNAMHAQIPFHFVGVGDSTVPFLAAVALMSQLFSRLPGRTPEQIEKKKVAFRFLSTQLSEYHGARADNCGVPSRTAGSHPTSFGADLRIRDVDETPNAAGVVVDNLPMSFENVHL